MRKKISAIFILSSYFVFNAVCAYETATHSRMSEETVDISVLESDPTLLESLGLAIAIDTPALPSYVPRDANNPTPDDPRFEQNATILEIIRGGSVLEDHGNTPINHFFDVQNGGDEANLSHLLLLPISVIAGGETARPSPDWILEMDSNGNRLDIEGQEHSYSDALDYFYEAVTSKDLDKEGIVFTEAGRKRQFGLMFRSLGHVIHHIQDMAQPQHVRNDLHCGDPRCEGTPFHNPSHYERYTNLGNVRGSVNFPVNATAIGDINFTRVREFWNNSQGSGLANFTALNFISQGTNFLLENGVHVDPNYPLPVPTGNPATKKLADVLAEDKYTTVETREEILQRLACNGTAECNMDFYETTVTDNYSGGTQRPNTKATSLSIFDKELTDRNAKPAIVILNSENIKKTFFPERLFALNRFNFAAGYDFLIPRAVAYGAGLINYFFRGRLEIEDVVVTANQMEITVKNVSEKSQSLESGKFELYYDDTDDLRQEITVNIIEGTLPLAVGDSVKLTTDIPIDVNPDKEKPFMLVFNGVDTAASSDDDGYAIGQESGIAAINFTAEEPGGAFLIVSDNFSPTDGLGRQRLVTRVDGEWVAIPSPDAKAGEVDWKGQYVNGKPTTVLTWEGEARRYFPDDDTRRSDAIYQNGDYYAFAPCDVLGAAIRTGTSGEDKMVVVCDWGRNEIRVFERPDDGEFSFYIYDPNNPETVPTDWRDIGQFVFQYNQSPSWLFNGDGTEAQVLLTVETSESPSIAWERIKVSINDNGATFENLGNEAGYTQQNICQFQCNEEDPNNNSCIDSETQRSFTRDGPYNYTVDYQDNQEVLGSLVFSESQSDQINRAETDLGLDYLDTRINTGEQKFLFGGNAITFGSVDGNNRRIEITPTIEGRSIDYLNVNSHRSEAIIYLDMRDDVVVYAANVVKQKSNGSQSPGSTYVETQSALIFTEQIFKGRSGIKSTPRFIVVDVENIETDQSWRFSTIECGAPGSSTITIITHRGAYPTINIPVTAATDVFGNTAISFRVLKNDGSFDGIHVVGDTDLSTLFPGAPLVNAIYDIRLIK